MKRLKRINTVNIQYKGRYYYADKYVLPCDKSAITYKPYYRIKTTGSHFWINPYEARLNNLIDLSATPYFWMSAYSYQPFLSPALYPDFYEEPKLSIKSRLGLFFRKIYNSIRKSIRIK